MSRDRAKPVCFPGVSCPRRVSSLSNAMTCHPRSPVTIVTKLAQLTGAARDSKVRKCQCSILSLALRVLQMRLSHVDTKGESLGGPKQVMWGPKDSERTESMASGCGRTLPEEGQVCRLLTPCSRILIMRPSTTGKHLLVTGHEPHEREAPPTPDPKQPKGQAGTPGAPGAQDLETLGTTPQTPKRRGENVSATKKRSRDNPVL